MTQWVGFVNTSKLWHISSLAAVPQFCTALFSLRTLSLCFNGGEAAPRREMNRQWRTKISLSLMEALQGLLLRFLNRHLTDPAIFWLHYISSLGNGDLCGFYYIYVDGKILFQIFFMKRFYLYMCIWINFLSIGLLIECFVSFPCQFGGFLFSFFHRRGEG